MAKTTARGTMQTQVVITQVEITLKLPYSIQPHFLQINRKLIKENNSQIYMNKATYLEGVEEKHSHKKNKEHIWSIYTTSSIIHFKSIMA